MTFSGLHGPWGKGERYQKGGEGKDGRLTGEGMGFWRQMGFKHNYYLCTQFISWLHVSGAEW